MATMDKDRGKRLRLIRKSLGETQAEFGIRFEKTGPAVSNYERGRLPEDEILKELFQMGFSMDWLLSGEGSMHRYEQSQGRLAAKSSVLQKGTGTRALKTSEPDSSELFLSATERKLVRILKAVLQEIIEKE